ncbi:MAG: mechanosensitive ion channel family protein, partial [Gemmata sp.]
TEAENAAKLRVLLEKPAATSEGAKAWDAWLAARVAPRGLPAEQGVYREESARLAAAAAASGRRVEALTGNAPEAGKPAEQTKLPARGGEIGRARAELLQARVRGLWGVGIKLGLILLAALILPRLLLFVLGRAVRGAKDETGGPSPVLAALRGVLRAGVWVAAVALILSTLSYDVTALVVALAIGALAVALAARPMIADVLGSLVIFGERRFRSGDVIRLNGGDPARVVGLTWRSTALKNTRGLVLSVPNRALTAATVENLSKGAGTYDALAVTVSTDKDAGKVVNVIRAAVSQCKNVSPDNGVTVLRYTQRGTVKVVEYQFWWFMKDYEARNKTRDEVFARIAMGLAQEDMTGIEVTLG